jgi:NitT/TauT family transport system permease protein
MFIALGFVSGAICGTVIGILTDRYQLIANRLTAIFQLLRPIPPIAFVPIVVLWFGVFWGVFFIVWIAASRRTAGRSDDDPCRLLAGTPERRLMREVLLPASAPYIFVGLRTSVSISFNTLVAAELADTCWTGLMVKALATQASSAILHQPACFLEEVSCSKNRCYVARNSCFGKPSDRHVPRAADIAGSGSQQNRS